jgi:hypothetical protein
MPEISSDWIMIITTNRMIAPTSGFVRKEMTRRVRRNAMRVMAAVE